MGSGTNSARKAAARGTSPHDERDRSFTPARRFDGLQWSAEGRSLPCATDDCDALAAPGREFCERCRKVAQR